MDPAPRGPVGRRPVRAVRLHGVAGGRGGGQDEQHRHQPAPPTRRHRVDHAGQRCADPRAARAEQERPREDEPAREQRRGRARRPARSRPGRPPRRARRSTAPAAASPARRARGARARRPGTARRRTTAGRAAGGGPPRRWPPASRCAATRCRRRPAAATATAAPSARRPRAGGRRRRAAAGGPGPPADIRGSGAGSSHPRTAGSSSSSSSHGKKSRPPPSARTGGGGSTSVGRSRRARAGSWAARESGTVKGSAGSTVVAGSGGSTRWIRVVCGCSHATSCASVGRRAGSGSSAASTRSRRSAGRPVRSCSPRRTRSMIAIDGPRPNGARPVPAYATVAAQRVHVGGGAGVVAVQDLGREVARRAEQPAGVGELGVVGDPGQAEVDEDRGAALHQHVGRLDVAVQDAGVVHRGEALGQAAGEPGEVGPGDRALLEHVVVQREAGHVAGGDVRDVGPGVGVDDLGDPAAADPASAS